MSEIKFWGFNVHYFNSELGIEVSSKKPINSPTLEEILEIISKFSGEDSMYMKKGNTRVAIETMPYGFDVAIETCVMMYRECSYEDTISILQNLDDIMEDPLQHGFILEGSEDEEKLIESTKLWGFKVYFFNTILGLQVSREEAIISPLLSEVLNILSGLSNDDCLFIDTIPEVHITFQKISIGFHVTILDEWAFYRESSFEEAVMMLENIESVLDAPLKHGFILEGTEPLSD